MASFLDRERASHLFSDASEQVLYFGLTFNRALTGWVDA
jgi:hypothetical protein